MSTGKKYEIDYNDFIKDKIFGEILGYRIIALKDFSDVKKGDKGGYILKEENLSQYGDCWLYDNAVATDNSIVSHNAKMYGTSSVNDNGRVLGFAKIYSESKIYENGIVTDYAELFDSSHVSGYATIYGNSKRKGISYVSDFVNVCGKSIIENKARISGNSYIEDAIIGDNVWINADVSICGNVKVVYDIYSDANISNYDDEKQLIIGGSLNSKNIYPSKFKITGTGKFDPEFSVYIGECEAFGYEGCDFINNSTVWMNDDGDIFVDGESIEEFIKRYIDNKSDGISSEYAKNYIRLFNQFTNYFDQMCDYVNKSWRRYIDEFSRIYIGR